MCFIFILKMSYIQEFIPAGEKNVIHLGIYLWNANLF